MTKNRKIVFAGIVIIIAIASVLLIMIFSYPKANVLIKFSLQPSDVYYSSYYFVLYDDATLKCFFGERDTDDIKADKYMHKIRKYTKTKLNELEFNWLIGQANELVESGFVNSGMECNEWYYVTLFYNGLVYREVYQYSQSEIINEISEHILRLAPMSIQLGSWYWYE